MGSSVSYLAESRHSASTVTHTTRYVNSVHEANQISVTQSHMLQAREEFIANGLADVQLNEQLNNSNSCPICLEDHGTLQASGTALVRTPCGHVYCKSCLMTWLEKLNTCPSCRKVFFQVPPVVYVLPRRNALGSDNLMAVLHSNPTSAANRDTFGIPHNQVAIGEATMAATHFIRMSRRSASQTRVPTGSVLVDTDILGLHIVAMANHLRSRAQADGRPYAPAECGTEFRQVIDVLWTVIRRINGDILRTEDVPRLLMFEIRQGIDDATWHQNAFLDGRRRIAARAADLESLLEYITVQAERAYWRREARSRA